LALRPTRPLSHAEQIAQRDAAQNDAFLREVDDALREDQVFGVFQRHGKPIAAAVVLGLAALAGGLWWNNHREAQRAERAEQLVIALDKLESGQTDAAYATLAPLAKDGGDGSQAAARLLQAAIAGRKGNVDAAAALYQAVAADSSAPKPYRDLATVRGVALRFDHMTPEDVVARLKPLAAPGDPWFGNAGELLAVAHLKQGHKDLAGPLLVAIARDTRVSESLRGRTRQLAGLLGFDSIDDIAKAPQQGGGAAQGGAPQGGPAPAAMPQPGQIQPGQAQPGQPAMVPAPSAPAPRPTKPANVGPISVTLPSNLGGGAAAPAPAAPVSASPAAPAPSASPAAPVSPKS